MSFKDMFTDIKFSNTKETSLSLMHEQKNVDQSLTLSLKPMEIYAFRTELQ